MGDAEPTASRWSVRQALGPTDAPPKWGLVGAAIAGLVGGALAGYAIESPRGAILSGLTAALVSAAGASAPAPLAVRLAGLASVFGVVAIVVAFAAEGHPVWAAVAMGAVALLASLATGTGPIGAAMGTLSLLAYVLAVALGTMAALQPTVSLGSGVIHVLVGGGMGLVVTVIGSAVRVRRHGTEVAPAPGLPPLWRPMADSLRSFDESARDGVRRAIPLALGIYLFELSNNRDALWIFVAAFVVLLPTGKPPVTVMIVRVVTTVVAVIVLGVVAVVVPHEVLFSSAIVLVLGGLAYGARYPLPASVATTAGTILFAGAPGDAIGTWATHRLVDTLIGCGLALAATYLLWPRDPAEGLADAAT